MSREAMKLALEALEGWDNHDKWVWPESALEQAKRNTKEAIPALRAALAEPEQEPVAWKLVPVRPTNEMLKAMDECSTEGYDERLLAGHAASVYMAAVDVSPLFTAPIPRKPVELTDDEIALIVGECAASAHRYCDFSFARAVIAAYEAKNGITGEQA